MRVLLLGGSGLLGGAAARAFAAAGHAVSVLARGALPPPAGAEALRADRRDAAALAGALAGRHFDFSVDFLAWDAADVERLFHVPRAALGRHVLISSGQVYLVAAGVAPPYREADAEAPLVPEPAAGSRDHAQWAYGAGKRRAETALRTLRATHGVRGTVLRLPIVQGAADGRASGRLWAWLERLRDGGPLLVPDGGRRPLRFVHADDVARALVALAERDAPPERFAYNLAQPDEPTLRELLALAAACLGASPRFVDVPAARLAAAGVDPDALPYAGRWCSRPDPALAASEWGFEAAPTAGYLPAVIRGHLEDAPPSHPGYAQRRRELELARALA